MARTNRECKVCGSKYFFCSNCDAFNNTGISSMFDTEKCKSVFGVLTDNYLKKISDEDAVAKLNNLGVTDTSALNDSIKNQINDLKKRTVKKEVPLDIDLEKPVEQEVVQEEKDEQPKKIKPRRRDLEQVDKGNIQ